MAERMWYYLLENEQIGPVSRDELMQKLQQGTLAPDVYVWADGLVQWQPASAIPELGGQPTADGGPVPLRVRPTSVTVFGILNIVFGGMGILCIPIAGVMALWLFQQAGTMHSGPAMMAYAIVEYIVGFFCAILQVATGIGLLYQKRWARQWAYGYGWFAIIWGIVGLIITAILFSSGLSETGSEEMPAAIVGIVGGIIGLVYPILLVFFMRQPNVIEACQR